MRSFVILLLVTALVSGCASAVNLESTAPAEPVTVDADLTEWASKLNRIDGGNMLVGVQNDGDHLYVALSSQDPTTIAQIMQQGLVLWIDPAGGKEKTFGIQYPIGVIDDDPERPLSDDMASNRIRIERSMQEVELIGAQGQSSRRRKDAVPGMEVHAQYDQRVLTYEAKVPLTPSEGVLYAVGARPGQQVSVGLLTPEREGDTFADRPGAGGMPGGTLSSADGRGRYGSQTQNPAARLPRMSHWLAVTLAE